MDATAIRWDESQHPRDNLGQFTDSGGGEGSGGEDKHPGEGYSPSAYIKDGVIHTNNVYDAQRALFEDRKVELTQPKQVSTLIHVLGNTVKRYEQAGETPPVFNLCNVSVKGTNLFCAETLGIPRVEMPVIPAKQTKAFIKYLKSQGYKVEKDNEYAANLRATQDEISGAKVVASMRRIQKEGFYKRLVVSKDDYILDGHHTWAGALGVDAADNNLHDNKMVKVARVDISITKLIAEAEKWTGGKGKKPASEAAKFVQLTMAEAAGQLPPLLFRKYFTTTQRFLSANAHLGRNINDVVIVVPQALYSSYGRETERDRDPDRDARGTGAAVEPASSVSARSDRGHSGRSSGDDGSGVYRAREGIRSVKAFDPDQPRDDHGRWEGGGYSSEPASPELAAQNVKTVHSLNAAGRAVAAKYGVTPVAFHELTQRGAERFHTAISAAKAANKFGAAVHVYPREDYAKMRMFVSPDDKIGFAVKGNDIVSGFKHPDVKAENAGVALLALGTQQGGRKLDAFDTVLPRLYSKGGYRAAARLAWDESQKPAGWDKKIFESFNRGEPDVVFMVHDPEHGKLYRAGDGKRVATYDEAVAEQDRAVKEIASRKRAYEQSKQARGHFIQDPETGLMEGSEPGPGHGEGEGGGQATSARTDPEASPLVRAGEKVDGLVVREHVPNRDSISASMDDWDELGVRAVPITAFDDDKPPRNPSDHIRQLADKIKASGEINPLIVAYEQWALEKGPYILEGGHRFDALKLLGKKEFPALVVLDTSIEARAYDESQHLRDEHGRAARGHFIQDPETGLMEGSEPGPGHGEGGGDADMRLVGTGAGKERHDAWIADLKTQIDNLPKEEIGSEKDGQLNGMKTALELYRDAPSKLKGAGERSLHTVQDGNGKLLAAVYTQFNSETMVSSIESMGTLEHASLVKALGHMVTHEERDNKAQRIEMTVFDDDPIRLTALREAGFNPDPAVSGHGVQLMIRGQATTEAEKDRAARQSAEHAATIRGAAEATAKLLGYDTKLIAIGTRDYTFKIGKETQQRHAAGLAHLDTGIIEIFPAQIYSSNAAVSVTTHEVAHQKYQTVLNALKAEREKVFQADKEASQQGKESITKPDGTLRDQYRDQYPLYARFEKHDATFDKRIKDDGVTEYSKAYWEQAKPDKYPNQVPLSSASHETIAEMAAVLVDTGKLPGSPQWRAYYRDIMKTYDELKAAK